MRGLLLYTAPFRRAKLPKNDIAEMYRLSLKYSVPRMVVMVLRCCERKAFVNDDGMLSMYRSPTITVHPWLEYS